MKVIDITSTGTHDLIGSTSTGTDHKFSFEVSTDYGQGGPPSGITVDSILYKADSALITADNG